MSKQYTPQEVALAVLNRCKELSEASALVKKEHKDKKEDKELCEDVAEKEVKEHEDEMHKAKKSSHKLKDFLKKKKKTDLKKIGGGVQTTGAGGAPLPGSTATTGGPSIASQIGMGKKEVKMTKPNLPKSEDGMASANKAIGLKPLESYKVKPPAADQMPEKPKAATTLKSYMAKRKK